MIFNAWKTSEIKYQEHTQPAKQVLWIKGLENQYNSTNNLTPHNLTRSSSLQKLLAQLSTTGGRSFVLVHTTDALDQGFKLQCQDT